MAAKKPDYSRAYFNLGLTYYQQNKYKEALEAFNVYIKQGKNNLPEAYYWAGVCSGYLNNFDGAVSYLKKSVGLKPNMWEAWNFLGMAYGNTLQWSNAIQAFEQAYALNASKEIETNLFNARKQEL